MYLLIYNSKQSKDCKDLVSPTVNAFEAVCGIIKLYIYI